MSLQYNPTLISIMGAFQKQGLVSNSYYTRDQLQVALDRMCGREYDRAVFEQLFEQCSDNQKQQIQLEELCQMFIQADKILKRKITQTDEQLQLFEMERNECAKQQQNSQYNHQLNQNGIEKDSCFSILLHQASNIRSQDYTQSFVTIGMGQFQHTSNGSQGGDKANPNYNQQFQFIIATGQEEIKFELYVVNRQNQQILLGTGQMDLGEFHDQVVHEIQLPLFDQYGQQQGTTLLMDVQWMYNKQKYHAELMKKYEESLDQLYTDSEDFKRDLSTIQEPFIQLKGSQSRQMQPATFLQSQQGRQSDFLTPNYATNAQLQTGQQRPSPSQKQQSSPSKQNKSLSGVPSEEFQYGFYLTLVMGILAVFECLARPAFVDILLFFLLGIIVVLDHFDSDYIKTVGALNALSIISDVVWLSFYKAYWNGSIKTDPGWGVTGQWIVQLTLIVVILNVILKTFLCYFIYVFYKDSLTQQVYYFQVMHFQFEVGRHRHNLFKI